MIIGVGSGSTVAFFIEALKKVRGKIEGAVASSEDTAKRLKAAFDKSYGFMPGTDEEAIKAVFSEIPTQ